MGVQDEIPDIVLPGDRPAQSSGCPVAWESWFAELSTWTNAASSPKWQGDGSVRLCAVGGMIHVHAVVNWDGTSSVDVGQPCAMDSVFLVASESTHGHGWMPKGSSGIIPKGMVAGKIVVTGWYPALLGDDK